MNVNLNHSTPIANRASSPFCYEEDQLNSAQLHVPIVFSSKSEAVSASTGLVASVTWPDLRYPCSLPGSYQEPRLLQHPDGNRATLIDSLFWVDQQRTLWYSWLISVELCWATSNVVSSLVSIFYGDILWRQSAKVWCVWFCVFTSSKDTDQCQTLKWCFG